MGNGGVTDYARAPAYGLPLFDPLRPMLVVSMTRAPAGGLYVKISFEILPLISHFVVSISAPLPSACRIELLKMTPCFWLIQ